MPHINLYMSGSGYVPQDFWPGMGILLDCYFIGDKGKTGTFVSYDQVNDTVAVRLDRTKEIVFQRPSQVRPLLRPIDQEDRHLYFKVLADERTYTYLEYARYLGREVYN